MNIRLQIVVMGSLQTYKTIFRNSPYHFDSIDRDCRTVRFGSSDSVSDEVGSDTVLIYVHGWMESHNSGRTKSDYVRRGLDRSDYEEDVVGYLWDSKQTWLKSKKKATRVGSELAEEINMIDSDVNVNLLAHSLGCNVVMESISECSSNINNVFLMGGATKTSEIPSSEEVSNVANLYNIYDRTDELLSLCFAPVEVAIPIGMKPVKKSYVSNMRWATVHHSSYYLDDKIYDKITELVNSGCS